MGLPTPLPVCCLTLRLTLRLTSPLTNHHPPPTNHCYCRKDAASQGRCASIWFPHLPHLHCHHTPHSHNHSPRLTIRMLAPMPASPLSMEPEPMMIWASWARLTTKPAHTSRHTPRPPVRHPPPHHLAPDLARRFNRKRKRKSEMLGLPRCPTSSSCGCAEVTYSTVLQPIHSTVSDAQ